MVFNPSGGRVVFLHRWRRDGDRGFSTRVYTARPTAVNLGAATRRLSKTLAASIEAGKDVRAAAQDLIAEAKEIDAEDVGRNRRMSRWGAEWLVERVKNAGGSGENLNVMTVCNTGSLATSVCRSLG